MPRGSDRPVYDRGDLAAALTALSSSPARTRRTPCDPWPVLYMKHKRHGPGGIKKTGEWGSDVRDEGRRRDAPFNFTQASAWSREGSRTRAGG